MLAPTGFQIAIAASIFALVAGYFLGTCVFSMRQERVYRKSISKTSATESNAFHCGGDVFTNSSLSERIINYMKKMDVKTSRFSFSSKIPASSELASLIRLAGLQDQISVQSYYRMRTRSILIVGALGAIIGLLFSFELALILGIAGAIIGSQVPKRVLKTRASKRAYETERHLPEMLDVMALCMRSGLSIDASISIYARHFNTLLANDMENARRKWTSGLERRDEALKKLASTYDSIILSRVVDTIIRSVRLGSSMVVSLENDAKEARSAFRSAKEERIAKAPVKMMIPTGVLILPAMLIMVLGPVLLELMVGGI